VTPALQRRRRPPARQRGLGIVELMVGVALGLLVVVGVSMVFVSSRQASRSTDSLGGMQETLRTSFELMARDLREAGGNPCDGALQVANVLNNAQGATPAWSVNWNQRLLGYDGGVAFPGAAFGAGTGQRVDGTDAVMVKFIADLADLTVTAHDATTALITVNNDPHRVRAGDLLMICDYRQAALLQASAVAPTTISHATSAAVDGNCSRGLGIPTLCTPVGNAFAFNPGAKVGRLVAVGWYVGNNGRPETGGRSLYRVTRTGVEEVAEGIQNLQMQYLPAGATDYVDATAVTDWSAIVGMRVALTLQSADNTVATSPGGRLQRPLAFTLSLRNRMP